MQEHEKRGPDLVSSLYGMGEDDGLDGHLDALIHLAAGYQYRESGIVEHLRRIASYVRILAEAMSWPEYRVALLEHASVFHDVGMVDVPETIVGKKDALTDAEMELMRKHTELGVSLLTGSEGPLMRMAATLAWCHHERHDGSGYPRGLAGEKIPMTARVLAVADVFDALTTSRPFKEAYPFEVAFEIVAAMSARHFDPEVVEAMDGARDSLQQCGERFATRETPSRKGFRISARDRSGGDLFAIAREGYFSCPYCRELHPRALDVCPALEVQLSDIHKLSGLVVDGKYRLKGALGVGGMGTVYEATHLLIDRELAIKFLDPSLARNRESLERFANEAKVFSTVAHPNLVEVTDMGTTPEGIPYMVMERLGGIDLARLLHRRGRLPVAAAVTVTLQVLETLQAVHSAGIIHRDLKPENIFLYRQDHSVRLKVLDFGISRLIPRGEDQRRLTQKGIVFGTPQYMSPEQAWGKDQVDHRSDLFTVGELLYEMVTGRPVFSAENNLAILSQVTRGEITAPRDLDPGIPARLERIILEALSLQPDHRPADARTFREGLLPLVQDEPGYEPGAILDLDLGSGEQDAGQETPGRRPAELSDTPGGTQKGIPVARKPR